MMVLRSRVVAAINFNFESSTSRFNVFNGQSTDLQTVSLFVVGFSFGIRFFISDRIGSHKALFGQARHYD